MAMCSDCSAILTNKRGEPGHAFLVEGKTTREPTSSGSVYLTEFTCSVCATVWAYENDRSDEHSGWHPEY